MPYIASVSALSVICVELLFCITDIDALVYINVMYTDFVLFYLYLYLITALNSLHAARSCSTYEMAYRAIKITLRFFIFLVLVLMHFCEAHMDDRRFRISMMFDFYEY